tara:strand:- start:213 stop:512 length:300 start_codon:yes stop_codon:yes gene_type:complete
MRSYPIYNIINSCAYASKPYQKGNKSYGVREHSEINVKVGSGAAYSNDFCTIKQTVKSFGNWSVFRLKVDNKVIKTAYFNKVTKHYTTRKPNSLKDIVK